jgi:hypothetical protein
MKQKWMKLGWFSFVVAGVIWIIPFSIIWLINGKYVFGIMGITLFCTAFLLIKAFVPWKYPNTKLWKLLIPPYAMFIISILLLLSVLTDFHDFAEIQYGFWIIPCFVPFFIFGCRTWNSINTIKTV